MSFGYDPEVPAGFQDADIEMAEMAEAADRAEAEAVDCRICKATGWIDFDGGRTCPDCGGAGKLYGKRDV